MNQQDIVRRPTSFTTHVFQVLAGELVSIDKANSGFCYEHINIKRHQIATPTVWVKEVIAEVLQEDSSTNFRAQKQKRDEIINEIKISANESKIRL